jgi:hypothetical protein
MKKAIIFTSMLAAWGVSSAQSYIGADLTLSKYDVSCAQNNTCEAKHVGYGFRAGAKFSPEHVLDLGGLALDAMEVGYSKFGRVGATGSKSELQYKGGTTPVATIVSTANSIAANALYAAIVAHVNVVQDVDASAKLGLAYVTTTSAYRSNGVTEGSKVESHFAPLLGVACEYALMSDVRLVAGVDFTRFNADGRSGALSVLKLGVNYAY